MFIITKTPLPIASLGQLNESTSIDACSGMFCICPQFVLAFVVNGFNVILTTSTPMLSIDSTKVCVYVCVCVCVCVWGGGGGGGGGGWTSRNIHKTFLYQAWIYCAMRCLCNTVSNFPFKGQRYQIRRNWNTYTLVLFIISFLMYWYIHVIFK